MQTSLLKMSTSAIGAYEAKTNLPALLAKVEKGDSVVITKHGRPVARLVPVSTRSPANLKFQSGPAMASKWPR